jgi:hypothetical protein
MPQQIYRRYPADQIDPGWTVVEPPYGTPYDRAAVTFNEATKTITITLQSDENPRTYGIRQAAQE